MVNDVVRDPARLAAVRGTGLVDSAQEEAFDRLTRLAAKLTGAAVTFISLIEEDRDFYKSCFGFPEPLASARQLQGTTFCHYAIASSGPLVIEDTLADPTYRSVPTVQSLGVRAYLGIPLVTAGGATIGSFCAIEFHPRAWTELQIEVMRELAASTMREIELRAAMETANTERSRLKVLLEHVPAGVVFAEAPSGTIVLRNRQAGAILGNPTSPPLTVSSYADIVASRQDGHRLGVDEWPLARALMGEVVRGEEILYQRADGQSIWLRIHGAPVRDGDGAIIGGVVAFDDIDEQRTMQMENDRLYEEARLANQAKDDFFAAVSHELRTPMTSILGWAKLLRLEQLDNPMAVEAAEAIEGSARLQAQLIDDLLDVSRITSGKLVMQMVECNVNEVIAEAVRAAQPAATSQGVRLRETLEDTPSIEGDPSRIRQVVGNLLSNAIKFTPRGGLIEVTSRLGKEMVHVIVCDTGRGIDADLLPHIFEKHRQARSAEMGGLGLGLTIVRHLVELHGGTVGAESVGAGKGATFTVRLPLRRT